ncbi:putative LEC14B -like protein [Capsicum annuum]|nr:putative LEC14B -like protein [Capsicum annuum]
MFPEDARIPVSKLISLWIAEGFVQNIESGRLKEEIAEDYLMDLISSNVVMVSRRRYNGKVKYCQVHDVVLHFCLEKSRQENFMLAVKRHHIQFQPSEWKGNRVSFSFSKELSKFTSLASKKRKPFHQHLRSLITTNRTNSEWNPFRQVSEVRFLKVLDLSSFSVRALSSDTLKPLIHLKYLAVKADKFHFHPEPHLPHLETLIGTFEESSKLENLRILRGVKYHADRVNVLLRRCLNLHELQISFKAHNFFACISLKLESLTQLRLSFDSVLLSGLHLPSNLKKLVLFKIPIENVMSFIARLPCLEYFQLRELPTYLTLNRIWYLGDIKFLKLKYLKLVDLGISRWEASEDSFPQLETLIIKTCSELMEIPFSFADITTLKQIKLMYCNRSLKDSAEKIKKEVEENEGCGRINLITIGELVHAAVVDFWGIIYAVVDLSGC